MVSLVSSPRFKSLLFVALFGWLITISPNCFGQLEDALQRGETRIRCIDSIDAAYSAIDTIILPIAPVGIIEEMQRIEESVEGIVQNTTHYDFGLGDIVWWNFGVAMFALVAAILAAVFGFLGFRYQKKAAIALEGREGKAFQLDIIMHLVYSDISSIISIHDSWIQNHSPQRINTMKQQINRIEAIKIPEDIIDPNTFAFDSEVYGQTVKIKLGLSHLNRTLENYTSFYGIDAINGNKYHDMIVYSLIRLLTLLGELVATINLSKNHSYNKKEKNAKAKMRYLWDNVILRNKRKLKKIIIVSLSVCFIVSIVYGFKSNNWSFCVLLSIGMTMMVLAFPFLKQYVYSKIHPREININEIDCSPSILKTIIYEQGSKLLSLDPSALDSILNDNSEVPDIVKKSISVFRWDTINFTSICEKARNEMPGRDYFIQYFTDTRLIEKYPHLEYLLCEDKEPISFEEFIYSALKFELAVKHIFPNHLD